MQGIWKENNMPMPWHRPEVFDQKVEENYKLFVEKFSNEFDCLFSIDEYRDNDPLKVICKKCGKSFMQRPFNHVCFETGCPTCAQVCQRKTTEEFIRHAQSIHGDKYDYSNTKYLTAKIKVTMRCKTCNTFFHQLPRSHIYQKSGCPKCKMSHGESEIIQVLEAAGIGYKREYIFCGCRGKRNRLRFDFFLPDHNTCIEFDGRQHYDHTSAWWSEENHERDLKKNEYCKVFGIRLIRITTDDVKKMKASISDFIIGLLQLPCSLKQS